MKEVSADRSKFVSRKAQILQNGKHLMKKKQLPSEKIQSTLDSLFSLATETSDLLHDLSRHGTQLVVQRALEAEADAHLDRPWYKHRPSDAPLTGHRNGYEARTLRTPLGRVTVQKPRLRNTRQPFRSLVIQQIGKMGCRLVRLATEMYVRGLSTRDIEAVFQDENGKPLLSRSTTSRLTDDLYKEYEAFSQRDLWQQDAVYLFVDGVYESIRSYANGQTILCAWAILSDGRKEMLHLAAVESESQTAWEQFFQEMLDRGLRQPLLVISDGAKGLHAAIARAFPKADRQRCLAHKLRNLAAKLPKDEAIRKPVLAEIKAVYYAVDRATAETFAAAVIERYTKTYPAMVRCFSDDLEACLIHLRYPAGHRRYIRTTNQIERSFEEEKRRTKTIPQHPNERGAMKLVFGVLLRVSQKWRKVPMTEFELTQLRNLRALKGIKEDNNYISYRLAE
jgi:putative transposase